MLQWWEEFSAKPFVAHILRAVERFNLRGGVQMAAAITYFSVLALVPIVMLAFSALGVTITVFRPEALGQIEEWIQSQVHADSELGPRIFTVISDALSNWASISLVALGITIWVGSNWVGNLKRAVRLLMREDVDRPGKLLPMPLDILANFAALLGIFLGVAATFAAAAVATGLGGTLGGLLGLGDYPGWTIVLQLVSAVVSFAAGAVLFRMIFGWLSPHPVPNHLAWVGAGLGSAVLLILLAMTSYLFGAFSRNFTAGVFGNMIVLMLFLNLFATLMLYIAAWLATAGVPVVEPEPVIEPVIEEPIETKPGELYVSSEVAQKSLGIGLSTGYVVGAATGLGVGAVIAATMNRLFRRRT